MSPKEKESDIEILTILAYGISGGSVEKELESITGVKPEKKTVHTKETGHIIVMPEFKQAWALLTLGLVMGLLLS